MVVCGLAFADVGYCGAGCAVVSFVVVSILVVVDVVAAVLFFSNSAITGSPGIENVTSHEDLFNTKGVIGDHVPFVLCAAVPAGCFCLGAKNRKEKQKRKGGDVQPAVTFACAKAPSSPTTLTM